MKLNFEVAKSWDELNDYQLKGISTILFSKSSDKDTFYKQLIFYLFVPSLNLWRYFKFRTLLLLVSVKQLYPYVRFLDAGIARTRFVEKIKIKRRIFYGPGDRLANLTIEEFSAADLFFYNWKKNNSEVDLDRLITVLYREKADEPTLVDIRRPYSEFDLRSRGAIIPKLDMPTKLAIGLTYLSCREAIIKKYPVVFPVRKQKNGSAKQNPKPDRKYLSFTPVMYTLSHDEIQPLGDFAKVKKTMINTFFGILTESMIRQKRAEQALKGYSKKNRYNK